MLHQISPPLRSGGFVEAKCKRTELDLQVFGVCVERSSEFVDADGIWPLDPANHVLAHPVPIERWPLARLRLDRAPREAFAGHVLCPEVGREQARKRHIGSQSDSNPGIQSSLLTMKKRRQRRFADLCASRQINSPGAHPSVNRGPDDFAHVWSLQGLAGRTLLQSRDQRPYLVGRGQLLCGGTRLRPCISFVRRIEGHHAL